MATKLKVAFDPRAEALSPWLWIPISVVALGLFVFLSISRREIIFAAYDSSLALLRRIPLIHYFLPGPIQLPHDDEYDSEEHDDELPATRRPQSVPTRLFNELRHSAHHITLSSALWGSRTLPTSQKSARNGSIPPRIITTHSNSLLERVNSSPLATANPSQFIRALASPRSPGRTSSPTLFDLGEEEEDANELQTDLSTRSFGTAKGSSNGRGSRGGSR